MWGMDDAPGPFFNLRLLRYGDVVRVHAWGQVYTYAVRANYVIDPNNLYPLQHEDYDWITLLTCEGFSEASGGFLLRRVVRAVLVDVQSY
jgi:LPXTG-site transpeptidase (sortase) family protein